MAPDRLLAGPKSQIAWPAGWQHFRRVEEWVKRGGSGQSDTRIQSSYLASCRA